MPLSSLIQTYFTYSDSYIDGRAGKIKEKAIKLTKQAA